MGQLNATEESSMMNALFLGLFCIVFAQRYPEFFGKQDLKRLGFMKHMRNPNPVVRPHEDAYNPYMPQSNKPALRDFDKDYENVYKYRAMYDEFDLVDDRISKFNAWDEFKDYAEKLKEEAAYNPNHDWHDDMKKIIEWSKKLDTLHHHQLDPDYSDQYAKPVTAEPSPGMGAYWAESDDIQKQRKRPNFAGPLSFIPEKQRMDTIIKKLQEIQQNPAFKILPNILRENVGQNPPSKENISVRQDLYKSLPKVDDFNAPIKWVPLNSNETRDGLAKVTDPKTNRNRELIINGTIFVPVIDYSLERLGLTSTTLPTLTTMSTALLSVIRSIDLRNIEQSDWLIFEIAQGGNTTDEECHGDGCQARCKRLGCESMCNGDTCSSGCVGTSCNTLCRGPGCYSMCIGEGCTAKCDGMSCDARCRGVGCEARCNSFSCHFSVNSNTGYGGGAWGDHYPQYNEGNMRGDFEA